MEGIDYHDLTLRRGETRPIPFTYRPIDKSLPPYVITGQPVAMKISPQGSAEIVYTAAPEISITNGAAGEITIAIPGSVVDAFDFQNAMYAILLNGKRLFYGTLTVKSLYE